MSDTPTAHPFQTWDRDTAYAVGERLDCDQVEALARFFDDLDLDELAMAVMFGHARQDEDPAVVTTDDRHAHLGDEVAATLFVAGLR